MNATIRTLTLVVVLGLLGGGAYWGWQWLRPSAPVALVQAGMATKAVPGSVTVKAEYEMDLKSEIAGRVLNSRLDPGLAVKAGEVVMQIDPRDLELEIEKANSDLEAAKRRREVGTATTMELEVAREALVQAERQLKLGVVSEADLLQRQRYVRGVEQKLKIEEVEQKQNLEGLENFLKVKNRMKEKMTITAPFDGVVAQVYARKGDLIGGGAPLARVIATSRTVEARISEENFAGVRVGQKAYVTLLPYGLTQYEAKVSKVLPTADPETQRYIVHLEVQIEPNKLVPGITGEVSIVLDERPAKAIVPRRALMGNRLFVVKDGQLELRTVKVGHTSLTVAEILEGVSEGEPVLVGLLDQFREGDRIHGVVIEETKRK